MKFPSQQSYPLSSSSLSLLPNPPALSKISRKINKRYSYPHQLCGTTQTSTIHIAVCLNHLLLTTLTITNPKSPSVPSYVASQFALFNLHAPQDHPMIPQIHQLVNPFPDTLQSITSMPPPTYIYPT